jgi:hypothetical protein
MLMMLLPSLRGSFKLFIKGGPKFIFTEIKIKCCSRILGCLLKQLLLHSHRISHHLLLVHTDIFSSLSLLSFLANTAPFLDLLCLKSNGPLVSLFACQTKHGIKLTIFLFFMEEFKVTAMESHTSLNCLIN